MFGNNIKVEKDLLERCRAHAKKSGYSSVEEFIAHALETELRKTDAKEKEGAEEVAKRLRGLGYID